MEEADDGELLGCIEALFVVVAKYDDAHVALILGTHMCPLVLQRSALPDSSSRVDGEVVANVSKGLRASLEMSSADGFQPLAGSTHGGIGEG